MDKSQRLQAFGNIHRILLQRSQYTRRGTGDESRNATIINVYFLSVFFGYLGNISHPDTIHFSPFFFEETGRRRFLNFGIYIFDKPSSDESDRNRILFLMLFIYFKSKTFPKQFMVLTTKCQLISIL